MLEWPSAKRQEISVGNDAEKRELSCTISECKLVWSIRKTLWWFLKKLKIDVSSVQFGCSVMSDFL